MFTIQIWTIAGWRKLPDCQFLSEDKALAYGLKYHTDKHGVRRFRVIKLGDE